MTVPATTRRAGPFNGNGSTTAFPFTFKVFSQDDIQVVLADADGLETTQALTTDYTVTLNPDQDSDPGGTITMLTAPATGETLVVTGALDYEQTLDLPSGGNFSPRAVENAFDRTVIQIQQLAEQLGRSLTLPVTAAGADTELPVPAANKVIGWNGSGTALTNYAVSEFATAIAAGSWEQQRESGDGTTTAFVLGTQPASVESLFVYIDGVRQVATVDYTLAGLTVTFTSAPPAGTNNIYFVWGSAAALGYSDAAVVNYIQEGSGAVTRSVQSRLRDAVHVRDFGVVGDGVTDDTEHLRAAHAAANAAGKPVSYAGVTALAVDADAQIDVNTDVDFAGCTFTLLNGVVGSPSFSSFNVLFNVEDPLTPLTTAVDALTGTTQLKKGNRFPTLGAFNGPGYALLTCTGFTVPDRGKTGTQAYTQSFKVFRNGESQHPISVDLSSDSATVSVQYRENSARPIKLENAVFPATGWNNQTLFDVNRNQVYFDRIMVPQDEDTADYLSVDSLIFVHDCSDIYISHFEGVARNYDISQSGYNLNISGGANIQVIGMQALNGWGAVGTNNVNGLYFSRSTINRVDAHSSGHNVFVYDCDIHRIGVVYGWGGGIWSIKNCRVHRCFALTNRTDYGGTFFGHIVISDIEVHHDGTQTYVVCSLETLGASTDVHAPETITIRGVKRYGAPATPGSVSAIDALRLKVNTPASQVVYAPDEITISDISSFAGWRIGSKIDILNMEAHEAGQGRMRINLSAIHADNIAQTTTGVVEYANARTPTTAIQPYIKAVDVQNLYISFTPDVVHEILCHSCDVNGVNANVSNTFQPYVEFRDCRFRTPVSGLSPAPLGGTTSSGTGHTILSDCKIYSAGFDFQYIAAAQGCLVASGVSPTLPGGVSVSDLFTGYVKAATFA